jgi:hypothetical protein
MFLIKGLKAQDTLQINQVLRVAKGEEYKIKAGTVVLFKPGARIWLEGGLFVGGTKEKPVHFVSENTNNPGAGIVINGIDLKSSIFISNATFSGLMQPISFEPFWSRETVVFDNITISKSDYSESVIFVSSPMNNLNEKPISFKLTNSNFYNNKSGIIIENAGGSAIKYQLDYLTFDNNKVFGNDSTLGVLHLNIAKPFFDQNLQIGHLAFNKNFAANSPIGLSVSGNAENIIIEGLYTSNNYRPVYDYYADPRLPLIKGEVKNLNQWPGDNCFIQDLKHLSGIILIKLQKVCKIDAVQDSFGNKLPYTQKIQNDSLAIFYSNGLANNIVMSNGLKIELPSVLANQDSLPQVKLEEPKVVVNTDSLLIKPAVQFIPSFEAGVWGGLAFYIGDIRHKFGIPGTYDWTGGLYLQYNSKRNWSYRGTFYRTNIGMHNPTAALQVWQGASTYASNNGVVNQRTSWESNFMTKMYIFDIDAIYHFPKKRDYLLANKKDGIGYWIPAVGFGVGFMRFDPYRIAIYSRDKDIAKYIPLRPLGTEGQNFLSNKKAYGAYTINFNASFQLAYVYKKIKFKYEFKAVLSMSDYLDDYGTGYTYGGNYDKWKESLGDIDLPVDNRTGKQLTLTQIFPRYNSTIKRTSNLLPDMFFQQHIGISYDLTDLILKLRK